MIVLGIHDGHSASACIMVDGEVKAHVAEERFSRLKMDHGYPRRSIDYCLAELGLTARDLDQVAYASTSMNVLMVRLKALCTFTNEDWDDLNRKYWKPLLYQGVEDRSVFSSLYDDPRFAALDHFYDFSGVGAEEAFKSDPDLVRRIRLDGVKRHLGLSPDQVRFYDHHTAHAAYALFASHLRDDNTLVYTLDGGGDGATSTLFRFHQGKLEELARSNRVDVARIYFFITLMMGMKMGQHEYKVMGLAPYAPERESKKSYSVFDGAFGVQDDLITWIDGRRPADLYFHFKESFDLHRFDGVAAATQKMCEVAVTQWVRTTLDKYDSHRAVFSGGVAMNVKLNMLLADDDLLDDFYVPPSPSDDTLCLGACYLAELDADATAWAKLPPLTNPYTGPAYDRDEVLRAVRRTGVADRYQVTEGVTPARCAAWLAEGRVVARLSGRMENGQRALGNRSILADPRREDTVQKINQQIKYRDFWMPFAPVLLSERAQDYLDVKKPHICRSYMMIAARTRPAALTAIPAAMHKGDNTVRPQVVTSEQNPEYYQIVKEFERLTGVGGLVNTSFNLHGEPIVCTPADAISTFERSELDVVLMDDVAVMRG
ncbi:MAG: carbamoyltransferase [Proteobacteria bacterium]|nr:carbamoyltransferase [Pseudomonadota bacterium]